MTRTTTSIDHQNPTIIGRSTDHRKLDSTPRGAWVPAIA